MRTTLQDLFLESTVMQGTLTIMLWGTAIFLMVTNQDVPDLLAVGVGSITTFWFRTKTTARTVAAIGARNE